VPAVLNKFPVIPMTVLIAFISTFITMYVVAGVNLKSLSASLGTVFSVIIAGIISSLVIKFAPLNGFNHQEAAMLWASRPDLDFTALLTAGVIIASLGAVMDVGMSIASSIYELKKVNNELTTKELITSGFNVGKDIMGTMANTLILAYIGSAFALVLLAANAPLIKLLNLNSIASEIASAITGSIGIVFCVPITAVIAGYLIGKDNHSHSQSQCHPEVLTHVVKDSNHESSCLLCDHAASLSIQNSTISEKTNTGKMLNQLGCSHVTGDELAKPDPLPSAHNPQVQHDEEIKEVK